MKVTIAEDVIRRPPPDWVRQYARIIEHFSYRPGVEIRLAYEPEMDILEIAVVAEVLDARDWDKPTQRQQHVYSPFKVPGLMVHTAKGLDKFRVKEHVIHALRNFERHEFDEWLRFDGEHVVDPHPPITGRFVG